MSFKGLFQSICFYDNMVLKLSDVINTQFHRCFRLSEEALLNQFKLWP